MADGFGVAGRRAAAGSDVVDQARSSDNHRKHYGGMLGQFARQTGGGGNRDQRNLGWKDDRAGGMAEPEGNHAKIGVSTGTHTYSIFGDMNQQGSLSGPNCKSSQNGRGGLFYVVDDAKLFGSLRDLIKGDTAPAP